MNVVDHAISSPNDVLAWASCLLGQGRQVYTNLAMAQDRRGMSRKPDDPAAVCWSIYGAVLAAPASGVDRREALHLCAYVAPIRGGHLKHPRSLLQLDETMNYKTALRVLKDAIKQAVKEEGWTDSDRVVRYIPSEKEPHRLFRRRR